VMTAVAAALLVTHQAPVHVSHAHKPAHAAVVGSAASNVIQAHKATLVEDMHPKPQAAPGTGGGVAGKGCSPAACRRRDPITRFEAANLRASSAAVRGVNHDAVDRRRHVITRSDEISDDRVVAHRVRREVAPVGRSRVDDEGRGVPLQVLL
jgi:hypothetical protein